MMVYNICLGNEMWQTICKMNVCMAVENCLLQIVVSLGFDANSENCY